jgi:tetratricopeptide (TPR) repeat protein
MGRHIITTLFLLSLVANVRGAAAQGAPDPETMQRDEDARELFERGETHYAAGRYRRAATLYEEAYELCGRVELLYNAANAYERLGEYQEAADHLRTYSASLKPKEAAAVRVRIARLEERNRERERMRDQEVKALIAEREQARAQERLAIAAVEEESGMSRRAKIGYGCLAGGGASLVGAIVFGVASASAGSDARALCQDGMCPESARSALRRERQFAIMTDVTAVVGMASVGTGLYLLWRDAKARKRDRGPVVRVIPRLYEGGAGVGIRASF